MINLKDEYIEKIIVFDIFAYDINKETLQYMKQIIKLKRSSFIKVPHMTEYHNQCEKNRYMSFTVKDKKLREKHKSIWNKIP